MHSKDQMVLPNQSLTDNNVKSPSTLHTNTGSSRMDKRGYFGSTPFWLGEHGIATMVSLKTYEAMHYMSYNRMKDGRS